MTMCTGLVNSIKKVSPIAALTGAASKAGISTPVQTVMGTTGTPAVQAGAALATKKKASLLSSGAINSTSDLLGS